MELRWRLRFLLHLRLHVRHRSRLRLGYEHRQRLDARRLDLERLVRDQTARVEMQYLHPEHQAVFEQCQDLPFLTSKAAENATCALQEIRLWSHHASKASSATRNGWSLTLRNRIGLR